MTKDRTSLVGALLLTCGLLLPTWGCARAQHPTPLAVLHCYMDTSPPNAPAIGFLGDSITHNQVGGVSPGEVAARILHARPVVCAVPSSATADWLGTPRFHAAIVGFRAAQVRVVSAMLGDNDSRWDLRVAAVTYRAHLLAIVSALQAAGFRVALQTPPLATTLIYDLALLAQYRQVIALVGLPGTRGAARLPMLDGVHPDTQGVRLLGRAWAAVLAPMLH